jgi:hypothetical protein
MPAEHGGGVATVVQQEGDRILISVPLVGFPRGYQLRPGQRVALVQEPTGTVARPLVTAKTVKATPEKIAAGTVDIGGQPHMLQPASVRGELVPGERPEPDQYEVWIVDQGSAEGPKQIIAIRPERTSRHR